MVDGEGLLHFTHVHIPVKLSELAETEKVRRKVHAIGGRQFAQTYVYACRKCNDCTLLLRSIEDMYLFQLS